MKGKFLSEYPEAENLCQYTNHMVAFLDILGFSKLVNNPRLNAIFYYALTAVSNIPRKKEEYENIGIFNPKTSILSDSIIISFTQETHYCFEMLIRLINTMLVTFLDDNILLRGAITSGPMYHEEGIVFGPALVRAHMLGEKVAIYPRCIIDNEKINDFFNKPLKDIDASISFPIDSDGIHYYDYFLQALFVAHQERSDFQTKKIMRLRELIIENILENQKDIHVLQKYLWMKEHFNATLPKIKEITKASASHLVIK